MAVSQAGYLQFLRSVVGVPVEALPDDSPFITISYTVGFALTPCEFQCASAAIYELMVYYAATSFLYNNAVDQPGQNWFANVQKEYGLLSGFNGIIQSAADQGTSAATVVPDWVKSATLQELQWMKDPFGQRFVGYLQMMGSVWSLV
ncbi:hypothetical protein IST455A_00477 [Burkholderia multivorans]|uniref:DUF4054 domain-containing protein n=1 Tax=Burkholderia multivorans TaxID=87883 RepID=A0AB37AVF8_9BURK|nr:MULTISPECIES: hypothetical protein [Burkholderia]MBG0863110.1 hypothetical protein [Burkholderia sp. 9779_493]MBU9308861.1 hypothetical protein [Burkholderia multivorans]MBU9403503.1 hypothetical protein [Burkholderia multivorans]MBU9523604.1 hypothetical protein [Burkholderia multivorans]MCO1460578.1 hypothetical protein [Burkholderia multivorans]